MAISVVGTPQNGVKTDGTDVTLSPGACAKDDILIVWGGTYNRVGVTPGPTADLANFTSWSHVYTYTAGNPLFDVAWCRCTAANTPSVTCKGSGNAADGVNYCCYVLRGVNRTCLSANATATGFATAGPTSSTNPDGPSANCAGVPASRSQWILSLVISSVRDTAVTVPSTPGTFVNKVGGDANSTNDYTVYGATYPMGTGTSGDPGAWTGWSTSTWLAVTLILSPALETTDNGHLGLEGPGSVVSRVNAADSDAVQVASGVLPGPQTVRASDAVKAQAGEVAAGEESKVVPDLKEAGEGGTPVAASEATLSIAGTASKAESDRVAAGEVTGVLVQVVARDGAKVGAGLAGAPATAQSSLQFDAATEWLDRHTDLPSVTGTYTAMAWAKLEAIASGVPWHPVVGLSNASVGDELAFSYASASDYNVNAWAAADNPANGAAASDQLPASGSEPPFAWHHIALVVTWPDAETCHVQVVVDGVGVADSNLITDDAPRTWTPLNLEIGAWMQGTEGFDANNRAQVAAVKVFSSALSVAEIQAEMGHLAPQKAGCLACVTGVDGVDYSGTGNFNVHGTPSAGASTPSGVTDWSTGQAAGAEGADVLGRATIVAPEADRAGLSESQFVAGTASQAESDRAGLVGEVTGLVCAVSVLE